MSYTTLISPSELAEHIDDPDWRVVDCRFWLDDTEKGRRDYLDAHIPGAVYAHLDEDLSGEVVSGETGRHPLPYLEDFIEQLSIWGIGENVQVVAYDDRGGAMAARLWWMLRWLSHEAVAILDGGWQHWVKDGYPVSDQVPSPERLRFNPDIRPELLVTTEQVEALREDPDYVLVDSRTSERYRGENEPIDPVAGHIPGALSAPYPENIDSSGRFLPRASLRERFNSILGEVPPDRAVFYCGSGVTSVHNIIAMLHSGLGEGKLYLGSWSEWITDSSRPVECE